MIHTNPLRTIPQEQWEQASTRVCVCVSRERQKDAREGAREKVRGVHKLLFT